MKEYTLLIWDMDWCGTELFLLPTKELEEEHLKILHEMNGKFVYEDEVTKEMSDKFSLMLRSPHIKENLPHPDLKPFVGVFDKYKVAKKSLLQVSSITSVVYSGFLP